MKTITYTFVDGTTNEVEVNDELHAVITRIEKKTANRDRAETRRHTSLERLSLRKDNEIVDQSINLDLDYYKREQIKTLYRAMESLTDSQMELVRKVFYEYMSLHSVAKEYGVSYQAVQDRLVKIYRKLRKFFE